MEYEIDRDRTPTEYPRVNIKPSGMPMIKSSRISVARVALDYTKRRYPPEEIPCHYGDLTLSDVFNALAYYFDHKEKMDRMIEEDDREFRHSRDEWIRENPDLYAKLMAGRPQS